MRFPPGKANAISASVKPTCVSRRYGGNPKHSALALMSPAQAAWRATAIRPCRLF